MRSLTELLEAALTLGGATIDGRTPEELDAAAQVAAGLSTTLGGLAKLRAIKGNDWQGVMQQAVDEAPSAYKHAKDLQTSPFANAEDLKQTEDGMVVLRPGFDPPPASIKCEEADAQRADPERISRLKVDGILYLEKVLYYTQLFAAAVEGAGSTDPEVLYEAGNTHMMSLECLPGSRPTLNPEDLHQGAELWLQSYRCIKGLVKRKLADAEDEVTVLFKLADAPPDIDPEELRATREASPTLAATDG
jgi:hypothetical protein